MPAQAEPSSIRGLCEAFNDLNRFSSGDLAELRRLQPEQAPGPAFWKLAFQFQLLDPERASQAQERRYGVLLQALATLRGMHDASTPLGKALASAGFSELRLNRLLRADEAQLPSAVRRMASFMASKAARADHLQLAWLVLTQDAERAEAHRRRLSRDFFSTLHAASRSE